MKPQSATPYSIGQRLRIWLWKLRYGWRIWQRSHGDDVKFGHYWRMCFGHIADAGWDNALDSEDGNVEDALATKPAEEADEELSYWTD